MFLMFLDNFDVLILKLIIFIKKILFNIFLNKKYFKKQPNNVTTKLNWQSFVFWLKFLRWSRLVHVRQGPAGSWLISFKTNVNIPVRFQNSFPGNLEYDIYNRETNRITICLVDIWSPTSYHPSVFLRNKVSATWMLSALSTHVLD